MFRRERLRHVDDNGLMPNCSLDYPFRHDEQQLVIASEEHQDNSFTSQQVDEDVDNIDDPVLDNEEDLDASSCEDRDMEDDDQNGIILTDDPNGALNPLTRFLFSFATRFALSDKAMGVLMQGLADVNCTSNYYLPKDFRTVEHAISRAEQRDNCTEDDNDDELASTTGVSVLYVCSKCNLHEFQASVIKAKNPCPQCGVTSVRCGYQRCKSFCVATSTLGNKSIHQLTHCSHCKAGPTADRTTRLYFLNFENHVKRFFKNQRACLDAMAPFKSLFTVTQGNREVVGVDDWLERWISHIRTLKYKSENWHGERFYEHPVWKEHGMRSLLLSLFIDWFPPFKSKSYSIGIISCSVMNLSCDARGTGFHVWPLAIMEGPAALHSTYVPLMKLCQSFESFYNNGIRVFDGLTSSFQTIHGVVAQVIGDSPALAKIGCTTAMVATFVAIVAASRVLFVDAILQGLNRSDMTTSTSFHKLCESSTEFR